MSPDAASTTTPQAFDRGRLDAVLEPIAHAHGAEVVDTEFKSEANGWVLRVFVEKLGSAESHASTSDAAVDLELCSGIARDLSTALDVADFIPHRYHLEISSPGVERSLKRVRDFERFMGQKAKIKVHEAVTGQKVLTGTLERLEGLGENVTGDDARNDARDDARNDAGYRIGLREGARVHEIAFTNVATARLVFEYGPTPKPGRGPRPDAGKKPRPAAADKK